LKNKLALAFGTKYISHYPNRLRVLTRQLYVITEKNYSANKPTNGIPGLSLKKKKKHMEKNQVMGILRVSIYIQWNFLFHM